MQSTSTDLPSLAAGFNAVDWTLLAILVWSVATAFSRGLIRELFALAGLFAGVLLAGLYYQPLAPRLANVISNRPAREMAAFLLIAIGIMVLAALLGRLLRRTASLAGLGFFDRLAGALFGLARGCLLGTALVTAVIAFLPPRSFMRDSRLTPYFLAGAHGVSFVVPLHLQQQITDGVSRIQHQDQAR